MLESPSSRVFLLLLFVFLGVPLALAADEIDFSRDIRPILGAKCYACHGPDDAARQAGLRLDQRAFALARRESAAAVVPGKPGESELVRRIHAVAEDELMPPHETKKPLTAKEKELLTRWIQAGAPYDDHWSFRPPQRAPVPEVEQEAWVRNEIDHFVLNRLEIKAMAPSEEADRITLLRRLSFDLRGLPPELEEVEHFLADDRPTAYENLVNRMLASPRYGERMCQDWLDLARYGDTNGYHSDSNRDMWLYRDYVIHAFNTNKPYDRFIVENLAGDLLPRRTTETKVASGFNRCSTFNEEGGADPAEFSVAYAVDRANTTGQVFLGLTFGCAQCHDHKYDPISQREYYQFYAFFNSVEDEIGAGGKTGHHGKPLPPLLSTPSEEQKEELARLEAELLQVDTQIDAALVRRDIAEAKSDFQESFVTWTQRIAKQPTEQAVPEEGLRLWLDASDLNGNGQSDADEDTFSPSSAVTTWKDRSPAGQEFQARGDPEYIEAGFGGQAAIRFDGEGDHLVHATAGSDLGDDFTLVWVYRHSRVWNEQTYFQWGLPASEQSRLFVKHITSHQPQFGRRGGSVPAPKRQVPGGAYVTSFRRDSATNKARFSVNGSAQGEGERKGQSYEGNAPFHIGANLDGVKTLCGDVAEVLVYDRQLSNTELHQLGHYLADKYAVDTSYTDASAAATRVARTRPGSRTETQQRSLRDYYVRHTYDGAREVFAPLNERVQNILTEREKIEAVFPTTMVMVEKEKRTPAYVLMRGDFQKPGDRVEPDVPEVFPPLPEGVPRNRLALAHWLTQQDHPLVARVVVNRLWKQLFGSAIVKTMGDFGTQGEWPSHPELLDWLAVDFLESGWDVKRLQKKMLLSATYRQASHNPHLYDDVDPYNRLLSRASRFRLAAEEVRDTALAVGGLLEGRLGGASVKPYQPADYYADKVGGAWKESEGRDLYRRGLYTHWRRTTLYPAFQIFDAPSREVCTVDRPRTNTPLQALTTLNDIAYVEAARVFAQRILHEAGPTVEERVTHAFRLAVARPPRAEELAVMVDIVKEQQQVYKDRPEEAKALAASGEYPAANIPPERLAPWTAFCNVILNLDEVFTRE
jgi:hypothetical protein